MMGEKKMEFKPGELSLASANVSQAVVYLEASNGTAYDQNNKVFGIVADGIKRYGKIPEGELTADAIALQWKLAGLGVNVGLVDIMHSDESTRALGRLAEKGKIEERDKPRLIGFLKLYKTYLAMLKAMP
jgi:hypothetical protein